jgi:hypothetical protein
MEVGGKYAVSTPGALSYLKSVLLSPVPTEARQFISTRCEYKLALVHVEGESLFQLSSFYYWRVDAAAVTSVGITATRGIVCLLGCCTLARAGMSVDSFSFFFDLARNKRTDGRHAAHAPGLFQRVRWILAPRSSEIGRGKANTHGGSSKVRQVEVSRRAFALNCTVT